MNDSQLLLQELGDDDDFLQVSYDPFRRPSAVTLNCPFNLSQGACLALAQPRTYETLQRGCRNDVMPHRTHYRKVLSSTKPEVHNVLQRRQRKTEPRPAHRQHAQKTWLSSAAWFLRYASWQRQRHSHGHMHRHAQSLITVNLLRSGVININD